MKDIQTSNAPAPVGPYTQAKESGGFVFCSGQIAIDPKTGALSGNIAEQTARVCQNIAALLEAAGLTLQNVVKTTCFLTDPRHAAFNENIGALYLKAGALLRFASAPKTRLWR